MHALGPSHVQPGDSNIAVQAIRVLASVAELLVMIPLCGREVQASTEIVEVLPLLLHVPCPMCSPVHLVCLPYHAGDKELFETTRPFLDIMGKVGV